MLIAASSPRTASFDPLLDATYSSASWYSADKETTYVNNSTASLWTDFGIDGRNFGRAGAVAGPYYRTNAINSLPAFEFSASMHVTASTTFTDTFFRATNQAAFIVFLETNPSANWWEKSWMACDEGGGNTDKWIFAMDNSNRPIWECHNQATNQDSQFNGTTNSITASTWTLVEFVKDNLTLNAWCNGTNTIVSRTIAAYPASIVAPFRIGWGEGTTSNTFTGQIAEILFYSASFSTFDRQVIEGYLMWKYGLQAKLPPSHPFAASPPTSSRLSG